MDLDEAGAVGEVEPVAERGVFPGYTDSITTSDPFRSACALSVTIIHRPTGHCAKAIEDE